MNEKQVFIATVVLTLMSLGRCVPLSQMKHITLHLQEEVLEGHKIVITFEPLSNDTSSAGGGRSLTAHIDVTSDNKTEASGTPTAEEPHTETPTNSSSSPGTNATSVTETPTSTKTGVIVSPASSDVGEPDVNHFLVTVPGLSCPQGFRLDPNGKCREVFSLSGGRGKSMVDHNSLSGNEMKYYEKKLVKKFNKG